MYEDILVATDGSDIAKRAAESAISLAGTLEATVHAVSVTNRGGDRRLEGCKERVTAVAETATEADCEVETIVLEGRSSSTILAVAGEIDADLIVVGTHGRTGLRQTIIESVALEVIWDVRRPVLTVGPDMDPLSGVDGVLLATNGCRGPPGRPTTPSGSATPVGPTSAPSTWSTWGRQKTGAASNSKNTAGERYKPSSTGQRSVASRRRGRSLTGTPTR